jgi:hypothetical protein
MAPGNDGPKANGLNAEIKALYRLPLEEFTPARNALAARLRKEKRAEDAAQVKPLPKPTPSAWAVNVLFEREAGKMDALLGAGKRARAAQREAVAGRGAEPLREAIRSARGLADELRWDAARILTERGSPPSRALVERIAANLQALAFSPNAAEEASRGWLDRDLDPPGFEVLAGLQLAGAPVADISARKRPEPRREEKPEEKTEEKPRKVLPMPKRPSREEAQAAEEERRREAAERARQEKEAERLRRRIAVAEEKAGRARAEADPLRQEAERLESEAADLRRKTEEAEHAAAKARERADRAGEREARAAEELRGLRAEERGR